MKKLLIVVDYQCDFVDGSLGFPGAGALDPVIAEKIAAYREEGGAVAFTFDTHGGDYLSTQEGRRLPVEHCISGSPGWRLFGETAGLRREGDPVFLKSSFGSEKLFDWLRDSEFEQIEFAGLVLNICVIANAVLAKTALPEAEIVVDAAAVAAPSAEIAEKTFDVLEGLQITVIRRA